MATGIQLRIILSFELKKLKNTHNYKHISTFPVGILQMTREKVPNRIPSEFQFEKQTIAVEAILKKKVATYLYKLNIFLVCHLNLKLYS